MNRGPLIFAIVLLLLPVLYVGGYLVMVSPRRQPYAVMPHIRCNYRAGETYAAWLFWPLEQIDRKIRPGAWQPFYLEDDKPW